MTNKNADKCLYCGHMCSNLFVPNVYTSAFYLVGISLDIGPKWTSPDGQTKLCLAQEMDEAANCCILKRPNYPLDAVYLISFFFPVILGREEVEVSL